MHRPMRSLPPGPVCLVGTDVPGIRAADIRRAFSALGRRDAVLGPADDGGFWLVGFKRMRRPPWVYEGVGWSRPDTLVQVLGQMARQGQSVGFTTRHSDVDGASDLAGFAGAHGRFVRPLAMQGPPGAG